MPHRDLQHHRGEEGERGLQKVASTYHTLVPPGAWTEQLKAPAAGRAGGNCVGGAGILASRLIIQNHVMSLYNFMHWLTMMMMTMTMAMIMTTPTQPDGDRDRHGGTEHRQTDRQPARLWDRQKETEHRQSRPSRDISEKATTAHAVRVGNRRQAQPSWGRSHHMWQSRNVVPLPTLTHTLVYTLCGRVRAWHTRQSDAVGAHVELAATR